MRKIAYLATALVTALGGGAAVAATDAAELGPSAGGISSENVEFVKNIPLSIDGVGGLVVGDYFYTNDQHKVMIFDITDPVNPELTGYVPMPQEILFSREDIDGNGDILVVPNTVIPNPEDSTRRVGATYIIDVEDKSNPTIISKLNGSAQHTMSCILDCKWAYGSDGNIIDLRNPRKPKLVERMWGEGLPAQGGHDVNEVAPGLVLTSTQPIMLLDVRKDPRHPKLLATGANEDFRFIHSNDWPNKGTDRLFLAGGERNFQPRCSENNGAFMTWDASKWRKTKTFTMIDEYRMKNGTYTDGSPAVNAVGCSSHWLEAHPDFHNGGIVAAAFFEHGTRFIDVSSKGKINEVGYFMPHGGSTGASYWITDEIVYSVDYTRGIDILRFTGK
ncbi:MAG: LVIVD repeat-containing protein [Actinomycetota bacterium]